MVFNIKKQMKVLPPNSDRHAPLININTPRAKKDLELKRLAEKMLGIVK